MKKLTTTLLASIFLCSIILPLHAQQEEEKSPKLRDTLLLKDYKPRSIHKIPQTTVEKAKYPVIDMHVHAPWNEANLEATALAQIKNMDEAGIERSIVFCGSGSSFEKFAAVYGKYPDRFELWCQVNLGGYNKPDFGPATIAELERCASLGAKGVGEVPDTGEGMRPFQGTSMHFDDPRMDPILEKLADLRMPINCHIGQEKWMYEAMDKHNDLLFEAYTYRIETYAYILDGKKKYPLGLEEVIATFEQAVKKHPRTTFIACHFLNLTYDLDHLGELFDKYPNLYVDISQREGYLATIPRVAKQFMEKYSDRIVWGSDINSGYGLSLPNYRTAFRILETLDDHFYAWGGGSNTRWCLYGIGLNDATLKKIYRDNALKILK